jgi:hypothetical protein
VDARASVASLRVVLTAAPGLGTAGRTALMLEATRIWDRAGVRLEWIAPVASVPLPINTLRVLAVARPAVQPRAHAQVWVLGELLRFEESKAIARLSLAEAERIVARARDDAGLERGQRVGVVLGRAAAHEIGHYLLNSSTHAESGLMRATFDESEFVDMRSRAFDLDDQAAASLRARFSYLE